MKVAKTYMKIKNRLFIYENILYAKCFTNETQIAILIYQKLQEKEKMIYERCSKR